MKDAQYWARHFLWACGSMTLLLVGVELFKGQTLEQAIPFAFGWGVTSSALFTAARYRQYRKGQQCAVCDNSKQ